MPRINCVSSRPEVAGTGADTGLSPPARRTPEEDESCSKPRASPSSRWTSPVWSSVRVSPYFRTPTAVFRRSFALCHARSYTLGCWIFFLLFLFLFLRCMYYYKQCCICNHSVDTCCLSDNGLVTLRHFSVEVTSITAEV